MQNSMHLQTLIIFSNKDKNISDFSFSSKLEKCGITIYRNPNHRSDLPPLFNPMQTLVVSDNEDGCNFAIQHNIPYIQQWNNESSSFSQKPVCYYDDIEMLDHKYMINQWRRAHHLPLTIAKTSRIMLKELTVEDIQDLYQLRMDPSFTKTLPPLASLEEEQEKHRHYIPNQYEFFDYGLWGIFLLDGTLIGQAGIENTEYQGKTLLEISYFIHPKYQRQGYATESILAIYHYILDTLELNRAIAIIAQNNLASIKTAMNLGMQKKESVIHCGFDCNYYVIDNIHDFLIQYETEQKRVRATKSAYRKAIENPVQSVYSRTWR